MNYVPMGPMDGLSQHPPFQSTGEIPLFNGQPDPRESCSTMVLGTAHADIRAAIQVVAALLTSGLDMPDGDLWNWLAFAETQ